MQSHATQCDLDALVDGPGDAHNINLLAGTPTPPATVLMHLRLQSLAKPMVPKIPPSRYLRPSPTAEAVKRPKLSFNSVARSIIKSGQHGIASQVLALERRVEKLVSIKERGPGRARRVRENPGGAVPVVSTNSTAASGPMKSFSEVISG